MKILSSVRFLSLLTLAFCVLWFSGCVRVAGTAGYSKINNDEVTTKTTGFDVDTSRIVDNRGVAS